MTAPNEYAFEAAAAADSRRTQRDAETALATFCGRLGLSRVEGDAKRLLLRYATDYPLNIAWYQRHASAQERQAKRQRTLIVWLGLFLLLVTLAPPIAVLWRHQAAGSIETVVGVVGVLVGGAFTALKLLATGFDASVRHAIFWNASADLKEALYLFEEKWHGKAADAGGEPAADFLLAVQAELDKARAIVNAERRAFFATWKSPSDLLAAVGSALDSAKAVRQELLSTQLEAARARDAAEAARIRALAQARQEWIEALAELKARTTVAQSTTGAGVQADEERIGAEAAVAKARLKIDLLESSQTA